MRVVFSAACAIVLGCSAIGQSLIFRLSNPVVTPFGRSVQAAGDLNRDGYPDFVIGNAAAARVFAYSGKSGKVLHTFRGKGAGSRLGWSVAGAGDVNKDGHDDIVVGDWRDSTKGNEAGCARVYSGRDGAVLHTFFGRGAFDHLGEAVAGAGDVNKDGHDDVIVGAPGKSRNNYKGTAFVFSGKDGTVLHSPSGQRVDDFFGFSVSGAVDLDRDGYDDFVVGSPAWESSSSLIGQGRVVAFSGKTGTQLWARQGPASLTRMGWSVSGLGDFDKDGHDDVVVGTPEDFTKRIGGGSASVLSGRNGSVIHIAYGGADFDTFGRATGRAGDVDGDGYADALVGAWQEGPSGNRPGYVQILSGRTKSVLFTRSGTSNGGGFGFSVSGVGDIDKDGAGDILVGSPWAGRGEAVVVSTRQLALTADRHCVSAALGEKQALRLDAGVKHAGKVYWVLGTLSGSSPGISLGPGVRLPLNPADGYFDFTLAAPNSPLLATSLGRLDANGRARATFSVPSVIAAEFRGKVAHHAFVVLSAKPFELASNAVSVAVQ